MRDNIKNDDLSGETLYKFLLDSFSNANGIMKKGASYYIFFASRSCSAFDKALTTANMPAREQLIWVKNNITLGRQDYQWRHEPCMYGWTDGAPHYFINDRSQTTVWEKIPDFNQMNVKELREFIKQVLQTNDYCQSILRFDKPMKSTEHPTMKPVELIAYLIKNSSRPGEVVLDIFGGSGTTLIAAEQTGRTAYLVELEPKYCDVIRKRYWKLTNGGNDEGWQDGTAAIND